MLFRSEMMYSFSFVGGAPQELGGGWYRFYNRGRIPEDVYKRQVLQNRHAQKRTHPVRLRKTAKCPARHPARRNSRRLQGRASRCGEPVGKGCRVSCAKRFKAAAARPRFPLRRTGRESLRDILREEIQGGGCRAALPAAENRSGKFA